MERTCSTCKSIKNIECFGKNGVDEFDRLRRRSACKDCEKLRHAKYDGRESNRRWRARNPARAKQLNRESYLRRKAHKIPVRRSRASALAAERRYKVRHRDRILAARRKKRRDHPECFHAEYLRRRGAKVQACGRVKAVEILGLLEQQDYRCANPFCCADLRLVKRHVDHKIPLSRGGSNDLSNLQWLCALCNVTKNYRTMEEWLALLRLAADEPCHLMTAAIQKVAHRSLSVDD